MLDFNAPFRGLLLEDELFRKPVSTFRDHALAGYRSRRWELGWGTFAPSSNTLALELADDHEGARSLSRRVQTGGLIRGPMSDARFTSRW